MLRRDLLGSIGLGSALMAATALPAIATAPNPSAAGTHPTVGGLDLSQLEVIDVHVHQPADMDDVQMDETWNADFVEALLPAEGTPGREPRRQELLVEFRQHFSRAPCQIGLRNYVARKYGVPATEQGLSSAAAPHVGKDYSAYYGKVLDREKVPSILLQSDGTEPTRPKSLVPDDRFVWKFSISPLLQPAWAKAHNIVNIDGFETALHRVLDQAKANGARGIKMLIGYYRPLAYQIVSRERAEQDLKRVLAAPAAPVVKVDVGNPVFDDPELQRALNSYQDYLLRSIYTKAGQIGVPIVIHTAVALHPGLQFEFNDPTGMYHVFQDEHIRRAKTNFVLIHTGYPYHHRVAAMLSQFPNVYTDLSFFSNYPGVLEETLRVFLAIAPSEKIMHGSDSNTAERVAYCAYNLRLVLSKVLNDYRTSYGWTDSDVEVMARDVMSENARRVYNIKNNSYLSQAD